MTENSHNRHILYFLYVFLYFLLFLVDMQVYTGVRHSIGPHFFETAVSKFLHCLPVEDFLSQIMCLSNCIQAWYVVEAQECYETRL